MSKLQTASWVAGIGAATVAIASGISGFFSEPTTVVVQIEPPAGATVVTPPEEPPAPDEDPAAVAPTPSAPSDKAEPAAPPASAPAVPAVPKLATAPAATETPTAPQTGTLRLSEGIAATICSDRISFQFTVAKQGTKPDNGIYIQQPVQSGRVAVGENFALSPACQLKLKRTGKTATFFAEFKFLDGALK